MIQLLLSVNEKVLCLLGSHESVASCCAPFFQSGKTCGTNVTLGRDVGLPRPSEGQPSVDHNWRLAPPDILAARTTWNHAKLNGSFATLWFFLMEKGESEKGESESLPEWPSPCCNLRQRFGYYESEKCPLTMADSTKIIAKKSFQLA